MPSRQLPDYYARLEVRPDADERTLEQAYHRLAKRYHPDTPATGDPDLFQEVVEAHKFLRDPQRRARYNEERGLGSMWATGDSALYEQRPGAEEGFGGIRIEHADALDDAEMIERILLTLYKQRREQPSDAGMVPWMLQERLDCPEDRFEFHAWYLKEKGYVQTDQEGKLVITVAGVDHIIATSRHSQAQKRITDRAGQAPD